MDLDSHIAIFKNAFVRGGKGSVATKESEVRIYPAFLQYKIILDEHGPEYFKSLTEEDVKGIAQGLVDSFKIIHGRDEIGRKTKDPQSAIEREILKNIEAARINSGDPKADVEKAAAIVNDRFDSY